MERRVLLALFLCFVVLYAYQALVVPPPPPPETSETAPSEPVAAQDLRPTAAQEATPAAEESFPDAVTGEQAEREIVVETATIQAVLTNRGGRVLRWRLKDYLEKNGTVVDLVPTGVPDSEPRPFSLVADDATLTARINGGLYQVTGDTSGRLDVRSGAASLVFQYEDASGVSVRKEFRFERDGYVVAFTSAVRNASGRVDYDVAWGPGLGDAAASAGGGSFFTGNRTQPPEGIFYLDGDVERLTGARITEEPSREGDFRFAGIDDHYFIVAATTTGPARVRYGALALPGIGEQDRAHVSVSFRVADQDAGVRVYAGPKQFDRLQAVDPEFVRAINFGIFGFLSIWLLGALTWIQGFVGNYGWSIITLTVLINLAIAPLRHKSVVSMRKMQALQPRLKAIQDHYAGLKVTDPARQKMNTEIMALYREKGVNPASGCLPMLATMPILFAFYALLSQAIELRGTDFMLWITDLSERDPYFVTPVLMALSMFWQQRITPSSADPTQQKVMMLMPLMFGVMFLWVPSGLVLYWFTGNLCAIAQQYFTNWMIGPPVPAAARPAADGEVKKAGSGRTAGAQRKR